MKNLKLLLIVLFCSISYCYGQGSIYNNSITGSNPNTYNPYTIGEEVNSNLTVSGIGRSIDINGVNANNRYNASKWNTVALDPDRYFYITITPNTGSQIDFLRLNYRARRSATGPTNYVIRSSVDNYTTDIATLVTGAGDSVDLSGVAFQNIQGSITFRIYAWGATTAQGTFSINRFKFRGTVVPPPCTYTVTWDGAQWLPNAPNSTTQAVLNANYNTSVGSFSTCKLTINSGVKLTIRENEFVEVESNIENSGEIFIDNKGSLVQKSDSATFTNSSTDNPAIVVDKITAPMQEWYEYTYWSSPLQSVPIGDFLDSTPNDRRFKFLAANFEDSSKEVMNDNTEIPGQDDIDDNRDDWSVISASSIMTPGKGYSGTLSSPDLSGPNGGASGIRKSFKGNILNTGIITVPVFKNNGSNLDQNWNLIGNPYPSAIDASEFFNENIYNSITNPTGALEGAIYFWSHVTPPSSTTNGNEHLNFDVNDYAILNLTANVTGERYAPDNFIPSGQGFFISFSEDKPDTTGNVVFRNSMRVIGNNDKFFRTDPNENKQPFVYNKVWLNLTSDNGVFSQIVIGYVEDATRENDGPLYDARRIFSGDSAMLFSIIENDDNEYAIQGREIEDLTLLETIRLGITTAITTATLYTISIDHLQGEFMERETVYVKDNLTGMIHNLKDSDYTFNSEAGVFKNRFEIVFNADTLSDDNDITEKSLSIIELKNGNVRFSVKGNSTIDSVRILNLLGQEVYHFKGNGKNETYNLSKLNSSLYIAQIELSNGTYINKKAAKK